MVEYENNFCHFHSILIEIYRDNWKEVVKERQKQVQRLFGANVLGNYDYHMLEYEITVQQRINELKFSQSRQRSFTELKVNCFNILRVSQANHDPDFDFF
jgi:hypothetical protein